MVAKNVTGLQEENAVIKKAKTVKILFLTAGCMIMMHLRMKEVFPTHHIEGGANNPPLPVSW
jgi:hypothetical protein